MAVSACQRRERLLKEAIVPPRVVNGDGARAGIKWTTGSFQRPRRLCPVSSAAGWTLGDTPGRGWSAPLPPSPPTPSSPPPAPRRNTGHELGHRRSCLIERGGRLLAPFHPQWTEEERKRPIRDNNVKEKQKREANSSDWDRLRPSRRLATFHPHAKDKECNDYRENYRLQ